MSELLQPDILRFLGEGLLTTLYISVASIILSLLFGTLLGVARYSGHAIAAPWAATYIEGVRT